jgi:hypothetical protein
MDKATLENKNILGYFNECIFIIMSLIYLIKSKIKDSRLTIASIAFLFLSVPLFGLDFHKSPRHYIPYDWYDRYDVENEVEIVLPYEFQFKETEELSKLQPLTRGMAHTSRQPTPTRKANLAEGWLSHLYCYLFFCPVSIKLMPNLTGLAAC